MDTHLANLETAAGADVASCLGARIGPIVPVILCGGPGTRLWPVSRADCPKPLWPLLSERTLLQDALRGVFGALAEADGTGAPLIVCQHEHRFSVAAQLEETSVLPARLVLEPAGRGSAAAAATAAVLAVRDDPDAMLWIVPANGSIGDAAGLAPAVGQAVRAARLGWVVHIGAAPAGGPRAFGLGAELDGAPGVFALEAPGAGEAAGGFPVGGGMIVTRARRLLEVMGRHWPALVEQAGLALARARLDPDFTRVDPDAFAACPVLDLDEALADPPGGAAVAPGGFGGAGLTDWRAVWDASPKDGDGNVAIGDAWLQDAERCLVRTDGIMTAVIGLEDAVVVVTDDAVLAMHRDHAHGVEQMVDRLRQAGRSEAGAHRRVDRPWGSYASLALEKRFQVKRIMVKPGKRLSLQKHFHRAEHWVVVHGSALVTRDESQVLLRENESIFLPLGCVHRLENVGRIPLILIEVQVGSYLGEDDIVRLDDQYGRL